MLAHKPPPSGVDEVVEDLRRAATRGQLARLERLPAQAPRFAEPATPLVPELQRVLRLAGIDQLYSHQAEAIDLIRAGRDTVIVTPTASGKTFAFGLPLLERLLAEPDARALLLYPTNALVNDQERAFADLLGLLEAPPVTAVLTGATELAARRAMRRRPPQILLTNPELLHMSVVGQHWRWSSFLRGLQLIVLDEVHLYRGLFGAHMAMTLRRLLRVAALHGARPRIVACSATIGNPAEVAGRLAGRPFAVVEGSGAGRGERTFMVWRPPMVGESGERADAQSEAVALFCLLIDAGLGTILFAPTRRGAESMLLQARDRLGEPLAGRIAPYRNGYSPERRREVEEQLKQGRLRGVVSTNALEVGIDIGGLDAAVIAGFPGSRTSLWQQAGRAGRGSSGSLVVMVPYERVVDGYYAAHPGELTAHAFEDAIVDLSNPRIVASHLACAAAEHPLPVQHAARFSPAGDEACAIAAGEGWISRADERWTAGPIYQDGMHGEISLRGGSGLTYAVVGPRGAVGTLDAIHAYREAYPGAIYLHDGERLRVDSLDRQRGLITVSAAPDGLLSEPLLQTTVHVLDQREQRWLASTSDGPWLGFGAVAVRQTTLGYRELQPRGRRQVRIVTLPEPLEHEVKTMGCWLVLPPELRTRLEQLERQCFPAGLHGFEHLLPAAVSLRLLCDPRDVAATYELEHAALGGPTLFLFDDVAGGAGISARIPALYLDLLRTCLAIVRDCPCKDGCPACIFSSVCWRQFDDVEKPATMALLRLLTNLASAG